jgi:predicted molibdopterin-dependent oxidoreductase YjgC
MKYEAGICTFCGTGCGHFMGVRNGEPMGVYPARNHPVSRGRLCVRGWHVHELLRTRSRLTSPLVRENGELRPVDYDAAVGFLADRLRGCSDAASEVAFLASPRASNEETYLLMKLARAVVRTGNLSVDSESGHGAALRVLVEGAGFPGMTGSFEEIRDCDYLLVVDYDVTKQNPIVGSEMHLAARNGARLVTIDGRRTQIARLSHDFLQVRPGSTALVLAALSKIVLAEGLVDRTALAADAEGLDAFAAALDSIRLDEASEKSGIPPDKLREVARDLTAATSAMAFFPSGISGLTEDTVRYLYNLFLLAGKVAGPGCGVNPVAGLNNLQGAHDMGAIPDFLTGFQSPEDPAVVRRYRREWGVDPYVGAGKPVADLLAREHPLKVLVAVDHDEGIVRYPEALGKVETVAYIGAYENPFTQFAHVVFPVPTYAETGGTFTNAERRVQLAPRKCAPPPGILTGVELLTRVAGKMGQEWSYAAASDVLAEAARLTPGYEGISHDALVDRPGGRQWPCDGRRPEGTRRLDPAAEGIRPRFVSVPREFAPARPSERFPFLLMIGKAQHYWHQNNLMKKTMIPMREYNATLLLYPKGFVEICSADAARLQVRDKWAVQVSSEAGSMRIEVKVSDDVGPGNAYVPYFVKGMIRRFLLAHREDIELGENASIPVRIEKVQ